MNEIHANDYRDLEHLVERMEEFIDNRRRLHSALGYRTPEEFEKQWEGRQGGHALEAARIGALSSSWPTTPSGLKTQGFRSFVRSWWLPPHRTVLYTPDGGVTLEVVRTAGQWVVPTENSVPINQHPCGTLIADASSQGNASRICRMVHSWDVPSRRSAPPGVAHAELCSELEEETNSRSQVWKSRSRLKNVARKD
jgi:hypothetical protein